jgi:hypothetical protein
MENIEKTVLEFSVEMYLKWHSDLYLEYDHTIGIYKEIKQPIVSKEYFEIIQLMVLDWKSDRTKLYYYVKIINAQDIDNRAVKFAFKQAKSHVLKLIDTKLIEFWNDQNPISSRYIANELDENSEDYIDKLEQSDAQKTTFAAANLINIKVYQWLCEYEKEYEAELLNPSVLEPTDEKEGKGLTIAEKIQLLNEIGFFQLAEIEKIGSSKRDLVVAALIDRGTTNIKIKTNARNKKSSTNDKESILLKIIIDTPKK